MFNDMFNKVWHYISIFPFSNQRKRSLNLKQKKIDFCTTCKNPILKENYQNFLTKLL